jgi:hypothetical protein
MKHKLLLLILLASFTGITAQTLQSPEAFLGYKLGTRFTPHYKIVNYFKYAAQTASANMKLQQYGETYEGRPLYVAFVSSAANMNNLETIRNNNLARTGISSASPSTGSNTALVWLSYNVHGNEASSSEASMQTLYELLSKHTGDWLINQVVMIDPCLNPDGRDRYVNWYNGSVGVKFNPLPSTREHDEPWPGGRTNHYYFDLNRDWAWQTQTESRERIKLYSQWMPQIHVDFHEQGYNEPYYFAPAAEPFHEVITPWQRNFQVTIGKNHAKYFDQNGWLYFTKERFDLFYPSYGDTWPTYNGAIGMTYEQGGHSAGGLGVINNDGDTLTLVDRVAHHTTTGLSTVEVAAQNVTPLLQAFEKFFTDSRNATGTEYKTYILTSDDEAKINGVKKVLLQNNITVTRLNNAAAATGYQYGNGKTENIVLDKYSIAISAYQSKSVLARVLLEPKARLSDSATYDITAWSLPYAHGVKAYATAQRINGEAITENNIANAVPQTNYALFVPYASITNAKLLASLLDNGIKVRMNDKPIVYEKRRFERGTLILLKKENAARWKTAEDLIKNNGSTVYAIGSGFMDSGPDIGSPDVKIIHPPRVGLLSGDDAGSNAVGEIWHLFDRQLNYPLSIYNAADFNPRSLRNLDVLVLADGNYRFLNEKGNMDELKNWLRAGGHIVAIENAAIQIASLDLGVKLKKAEEEGKDDAKKTDVYADIKKFENRERDWLPNATPGAIYRVDMDDTHPLAYGYGREYFSLKQNSEVLEFLKEGWNVGVIKTGAKMSGFAGAKATGKIKDGTVMAVQDIGRGAMVYIIDNTMFRSFWENGKLLFFNAVFLVGNNPIRL